MNTCTKRLRFGDTQRLNLTSGIPQEHTVNKSKKKNPVDACVCVTYVRHGRHGAAFSNSPPTTPLAVLRTHRFRLACFSASVGHDEQRHRVTGVCRVHQNRLPIPRPLEKAGFDALLSRKSLYQARDTEQTRHRAPNYHRVQVFFYALSSLIRLYLFGVTREYYTTW